MGKRGRKTKFKEELIDQAEKLGALGLNLTQIAHVIDVRPETLSRWQNKHPEFSQAIKSGADKANAKVISTLLKLGTDKENLGALIFWLKNRAAWKDQPIVDQSKHNHFTINIERADEDGEDLQASQESAFGLRG